jgi:GNAT superfamily N-acetyltransferase
MGYVIRPVASLQELAQTFDLLGAQLPQPLTHRDRRFAELARRFPADRTLMLVAEDQGGIVGGALAFRTGAAAPACGVTLRLIAVTPAHLGRGLGRRLVEEVETATVRLGAREISLGASGAERGFYLHLGYSGRARLRKQLPRSLTAGRRPAEDQRRDRGLATRAP